MNGQSRRTMKWAGEGFSRLSAKTAGLYLLPWLLVIAACDGANQGVQIGTGQDRDPVVIDFPIAYIRAPLPLDDNGQFEQQDLREQITFPVGSDVFFRDRAAPGAEDTNITGRFSEGLHAVRDVEIDYDGSRLLFAMRGPVDENLDLDDEDQPTWNIWQYTFETDELIRVISSDLTAEIGHDIMPKYLPDGRIIFSSTRQLRSQAVLLDEGRPAFPALDEDENEFAFTLHVMNADGTGLEQVSYNQSHDLDPSVLSNGQIVFSRWDHEVPHNAVDLYRMNPDGSGLELLYGKQSHDTGADGETIQFMQPRELEDGRIMTLIRPFTNTEGGGELILIDTVNYLENTQPIAANIGVLNGPAQEDATVNEVSTVPGAPSVGGRYNSVYPIQDGTGRLMVSWSQCRLQEVIDIPDPMNPPDPVILPCTDDRLAEVVVIDPNNPVTPPVGSIIVAQPLYGIWMYDPRDETQLPIVTGEEGFMYTEVVSADPRPIPAVILDGIDAFQLDSSLADNGEGVLNIRSVYDFDGGAVVNIAAMADPLQTLAADRPARFLRVEKIVSIPDGDIVDLDNTDYGISVVNGMRGIVAYAPIEPDGSVITKVPANTALAISVLDANGRRISPRHRNWISVRPGQELRCNGCHVPGTDQSHGRYEAYDSAYAGAPTAGVEFPNTDPRWFVGDIGETMAEVRARITCTDDGCSSIQPSLDLVYRDVWTADPVIRANNADIDYLYSELPLPPTSLACMATWQATCRSTIHYIEHIHPIWSQARLVFDNMGNPVLDGNGVQVSNNCLNCHTPVNPVDAQVRVPAGQLELQDGLSPDEPDHYHAYRELLVADNLQEVVNGALVDAQQQVGVDVDGNPIFDVIPIASPASIAGANASGDLFDRFDDPNDLHYNILSVSERRLIAEWLDVGAQYYNSPFDVPVN